MPIKNLKSTDMKKLIFLPVILCLTNGCTEKPAETFTRSVMVTTPVRFGAERVKHFSGVVRESHDISLGFKTPGQIEQIMVKEGDYVKKGQLIARLDDADYKLGVEALEIQYRQLEDEVKRLETLYRSKSVSVNDYEKAVSGLQQLKVQLQVNRNKLDYTRLYAPTDGYVQSVNFAPAEMVDAGTPVINLLDVHRIEVETELPADVYLLRSRFGQITSRASFRNTGEMPMQIISITPKADGNQLYQMKLAFDGKPDTRLSAGMNIGITIRINRTDSTGKTFTLPLHAIVRQQEETYVWIVETDSTVSRRKVVCNGIDGTGAAIISAGLNGKEQVVKAGVNALQEKEKVRVTDTESKTNVGGLI